MALDPPMEESATLYSLITWRSARMARIAIIAGHVALQGYFRISETGLILEKLRVADGEVRLCLVDHCLIGTRIDLGANLTFFTPVL
jgi:hypothetical protein